MQDRKMVDGPAKKRVGMEGIKWWRNIRNGFMCVELHYTADKLKRGKFWKQKAKKGYPDDRSWDQEMEIDFTTISGRAVFGGLYKSEVHNTKSEYADGETLYRGWDFGFIHPACLITKINTKDQWVWMKEYMGENIILPRFIEEVRSEINDKYPNAVWWDYCDPAWMQHSDKSEKTSVDILNDYGIFPTYTVMHPNDRVKIIQNLLAIRKDGSPGLLIDEDGCPLCAEAMKGAYVFSNTQGQEKPQKDGWYEHLMETAQYIAATMPLFNKGNKERKEFDPYLMGDSLTGY